MSLFSSRKIAVSLSVLALSTAAVSASADEVPNMYMSSKQLKIVEQVSPDYPRFADMAGVDGYVVVEFTVSSDGSVMTPAVAKSSSGHFSESALSAISRWQFEPAMDNGVAVPVRSNMKFSFVPRT